MSDEPKEQLTKDQALAAYGNVPCRFTGYYKYTFDFTGAAPDGAEIHLSVGGSSGDIYRLTVTPESTECLAGQDYRYAQIKKDGVDIYSEDTEN